MAADRTAYLLELCVGCADWAETVASSAVAPLDGSPGSDGLALVDRFATSVLEHSLVDLMHDRATALLLATVAHERAACAVVAAPGLPADLPSGVLARAASEAAGTLDYLLIGGSTRDRVYRSLFITVSASNDLQDAFGTAEARQDRDRWRDAGTELGYDPGPKKNFETVGMSRTALLERGLPDLPEQMTKIVRSYLGAITHGLPTAGVRNLVITTSSQGLPQPELTRITEQEDLMLWIAAGAVIRAGWALQNWAVGTVDETGHGLLDRWRVTWSDDQP